MAILDWPTGDEFKPMQPLALGFSTPKSAFVGAYTGERQAATRAADRMVMEMVLPPCRGAAARRRAAWLASLASTGDWVRMPAWSQRYPLGTIGGSPTVNGAVTAGARSIALANVLSRPNLLFSSGFEIDTNADGLADGWTQYSTGTTGTITRSRVAGNGSTWAQRFDATGLGGTAADQVGLRYSADAGVTAGLSYALSADTRDNGLPVRVHIDWFNVSAVFISSSTAVFSSSGSVWTRRSVVGVAPAGAVVAKLYVWMEARPGGAGAAAIEIDDVQFEQAAAATGYAGLPTVRAGDVIAVGGNLLMVGPNDATLTDAGAGAVNLVAGAPRAISNGAAVTYMAPTGVWQLDTLEAPPAEWGAVQAAVSLIWRQVAQ